MIPSKQLSDQDAHLQLMEMTLESAARKWPRAQAFGKFRFLGIANSNDISICGILTVTGELENKWKVCFFPLSSQSPPFFFFFLIPVSNQDESPRNWIFLILRGRFFIAWFWISIFLEGMDCMKRNELHRLRKESAFFTSTPGWLYFRGNANLNTG